MIGLGKGSVMKTNDDELVEIVDDEQAIQEGLLLEMAQVADFNGYKLIIWTNDEGKIPHFHVVKGKKPSVPDFDCCIKFQCAEYYPYGGKHTDRLPRNQLKKFIELLNSKDKYDETHTVWESLIIEWNRNNNRTRIPSNITMPDYMHIV